MGAVYRATDTKLHRDVAIKVLPDSCAQDPDRLARFTREAQVPPPWVKVGRPHAGQIAAALLRVDYRVKWIQCRILDPRRSLRRQRICFLLVRGICG
jgi:hypothetical protein